MHAPRSSVILIALCATVSVTAGCQQTLMPTPVAYHDGAIDPFYNTPADEQSTTVEIF